MIVEKVLKRRTKLNPTNETQKRKSLFTKAFGKF